MTLEKLLGLIFAWLIIGYATIVIAGAFLTQVFTTFGLFTAIGFFITLVISVISGFTKGDFGNPGVLLKKVFAFSVGYIGANVVGKAIISFIFNTSSDPLAMLIGLAALVPIWLTFKEMQ